MAEPSENATAINLIEVTPTTVDFLVYSLAAIFGTFSNAILVYAIHRHLGHFGQRLTFTFLVKYLCILDLILCILIPFDLLMVTQFHDLAYIELFVHPRNLVLTFESLVLLFISIDRFMAIKLPFSSYWNCCFIYIFLGILSGLVVITDVAIVIQMYCCSRYMRLIGIFTYIGVYTGILLLILFLTYTFYFLVFVAFYRHSQYMNTNLPMRQVNTNATGSEQPNNEESAPDEHSSGDHFSPSTYLRLARILICVTLVYTVSIIPHLLIGIELIEFKGYMLYYLFYINAVVNPFILIATDAKLREDIRARFQIILKTRNRAQHQFCPTVNTDYE